MGEVRGGGAGPDLRWGDGVGLKPDLREHAGLGRRLRQRRGCEGLGELPKSRRTAHFLCDPHRPFDARQ